MLFIIINKFSGKLCLSVKAFISAEGDLRPRGNGKNRVTIGSIRYKSSRRHWDLRRSVGNLFFMADGSNIKRILGSQCSRHCFEYFFWLEHSFRHLSRRRSFHNWYNLCARYPDKRHHAIDRHRHILPSFSESLGQRPNSRRKNNYRHRPLYWNSLITDYDHWRNHSLLDWI